MEFVKESLVFTGEESPMTNLMLSVMGAFAEFKRSIIRERQWEGHRLGETAWCLQRTEKDPHSRTGRRTGPARQRCTEALLARDYGISRETVGPLAAARHLVLVVACHRVEQIGPASVQNPSYKETCHHQEFG